MHCEDTLIYLYADGGGAYWTRPAVIKIQAACIYIYIYTYIYIYIYTYTCNNTDNNNNNMISSNVI